MSQCVGDSNTDIRLPRPRFHLRHSGLAWDLGGIIQNATSPSASPLLPGTNHTTHLPYDAVVRLTQALFAKHFPAQSKALKRG